MVLLREHYRQQSGEVTLDWSTIGLLDLLLAWKFYRGPTVSFFSSSYLISNLRPPLIRLPIEKPMSMLSQRRSDVTPMLTGMTDPFLYNPRKSMTGQVSIIILYISSPFSVESNPSVGTSHACTK